MSILLFAITTSSVTVKTQLQMHQTLLEMRQHQLIKRFRSRTESATLSVMLVKPANQTMCELGISITTQCNKTGEAVNATANELGKNASDVGSTY